jgi:molybdopterin/thiamine biosynthesis adenylyltransferase
MACANARGDRGADNHGGNMVAAGNSRHHRTSLLLEALDSLSADAGAELLDSLVFGLRVAPGAAGTLSGQAAALTAANLLARLGGTVLLDVPSVQVDLRGTPWSDMRLDQACGELIARGGGRAEERSSPTALVVGGRSTLEEVSIGGSDWVSVVDEPNPELTGSHPFGSMAAACFGTARVFHEELQRRIGLAGPPRTPQRFSILSAELGQDHPISIGPVTMPVALVGAGAVGQALAWSMVLGQVDLTGVVDIIDPQTLDTSNLNRHLVSAASDVGQHKAQIVANFLSPCAPLVQPWLETFAEFRTHHPNAQELVVSTVDNDMARYEIQGSFPRRLLHGATSQEKISVATIDALNGACLACLFPQRQQSPAAEISRQTGIPQELVADALATHGVVTDEMLRPLAERMGISPSELEPLVGIEFREAYAREICGRLGLTTDEATPTPTVAYVSALAGCLLAAEIVRAGSSASATIAGGTYAQLALLHPESAWRAVRGKDPDCPLMCGSNGLKDFIRGRWITTRPT